MAVRIFTINEGEEAMIRVNSGKPITLEFPGHLVTVYEDRGVIFQRVEKQSEEEEQTQEVEEVEADPYEETQVMDDGYGTELEGEDGETQIERTPCWSTPQSLMDALDKAAKYLTGVDLSDMQALRHDLFGAKKN